MKFINIIYFILTLLIILIIFLLYKKFNKKRKIIDIGILFTTKGGPMALDEIKLYKTLNQ